MTPVRVLWPILFVLFLFMMVGVPPFSYYDGDVYFHLLRFQDFWTSGSLAETLFMHTNPPLGEVSHFTRLFDLVTLPFVYPLSFFTGVSAAFGWVANFLPVVLFALSGLWLWYGLRPYAKNVWVGVTAFCLLPYLSSYARFGRYDHHCLQIFLFAGAVAFFLRYLKDGLRNRLFWLALFLTLSFWVNVEGLLLYLFFTGFLFLRYLQGKEKIQNLTAFQSYNVVTFFFALLINPPMTGFYTPDVGRMSFIYLLFYLWVLFTFLVLRFLPNKLPFKLVVPVFFASNFVFLFHTALFMPLMSSFLYANWYSHIDEVAPLLTGGTFFTFFMYDVAIVFAFLFLPKKEPVSFALKKAIIFFLLLTFIHLRFGVYLSILLAFALALCFHAKRSIKYYLVLTVLGFLLPLFIQSALHGFNMQKTKRLNPSELLPYVRYLETEGTILSETNTSLYWTYMTKRPSIAGNYHLNENGIRFVYNIFSEKDMDTVLTMLRSRNITTVILAKKSRPVSIPEGNGMFFDRLVSADYPDFIAPVQLPENLSVHWGVYSVTAE